MSNIDNPAYWQEERQKALEQANLPGATKMTAKGLWRG